MDDPEVPPIAIVPVVVSDPTDLVAAIQISVDRHPAAVYLARLAPGSRRTMKGALNVVARHLTAGACDLFTLDWKKVRYQHTAAVRSVLADQYSPGTANKILSALRGVLQETWRLGHIPAEEYHRRGTCPPCGAPPCRRAAR